MQLLSTVILKTGANVQSINLPISVEEIAEYNPYFLHQAGLKTDNRETLIVTQHTIGTVSLQLFGNNPEH